MRIETGTFESWTRKERGTNWTLLTGKGEREYRKKVNFQKHFSSPPTVHVSLNMFDLLHGTNHRLKIFAENVTDSEFDVVFITWADTLVYGVGVSWLAIGEN